MQYDEYLTTVVFGWYLFVITYCEICPMLAFYCKRQYIRNDIYWSFNAIRHHESHVSRILNSTFKENPSKNELW